MSGGASMPKLRRAENDKGAGSEACPFDQYWVVTRIRARCGATSGGLASRRSTSCRTGRGATSSGLASCRLTSRSWPYEQWSCELSSCEPDWPYEQWSCELPSYEPGWPYERWSCEPSSCERRLASLSCGLSSCELQLSYERWSCEPSSCEQWSYELLVCELQCLRAVVLRAVVLRAVVLRAAGLRAAVALRAGAALRAVVLRAVVLRAVVLRAGAAAVVLRAVVLRAVVFLATALRAVVLRAEAAFTVLFAVVLRAAGFLAAMLLIPFCRGGITARFLHCCNVFIVLMKWVVPAAAAGPLFRTQCVFLCRDKSESKYSCRSSNYPFIGAHRMLGATTSSKLFMPNYVAITEFLLVRLHNRSSNQAQKKFQKTFAFDVKMRVATTKAHASCCVKVVCGGAQTHIHRVLSNRFGPAHNHTTTSARSGFRITTKTLRSPSNRGCSEQSDKAVQGHCN